MSSTTTSRLGLIKPTPGTGEPVNVATQINQAWDKIDAAIGATICTSTTRPSPAFDGQIIRETDTGVIAVRNDAAGTWVSIYPPPPQAALPGIAVRQTNLVAQSIPHNSETKITWDTTDQNIGFTFTSGTDVVLPENGVYMVTCTVRWASNGTGFRRIALYLNATLYGDMAIPSVGGSTTHPMSVSTLIRANAGNIVDVRATQTSGAPLAFGPTSRTPNMFVWRVA